MTQSVILQYNGESRDNNSKMKCVALITLASDDDIALNIAHKILAEYQPPIDNNVEVK